MPTLYFTMLGDSADYSEWKNGRRATGLIYSAGTFVQKTGGGFAGALVLVVLAGYGYNGMDKSTIEASLPGMQLLDELDSSSLCLCWCSINDFLPTNNSRQPKDW